MLFPHTSQGCWRPQPPLRVGSSSRCARSRSLSLRDEGGALGCLTLRYSLPRHVRQLLRFIVTPAVGYFGARRGNNYASGSVISFRRANQTAQTHPRWRRGFTRGRGASRRPRRAAWLPAPGKSPVMEIYLRGSSTVRLAGRTALSGKLSV